MADAPAPASLSLKRVLPVAALVVTGVAVVAVGWGEYLSLAALKEHRAALTAWHEARPLASAAAFMVVYALAVMLSVPGSVWFTVIGGFLFGLVQGTLLTVIAATFGACAIFLAARYAFADYFRAKAGPTLARMERGFRENALSYLLFLRLIPIFPFWLVNLVPALLGVPLGTYFIGTLIGILPGSFLYTLVGYGIGAVIDAGDEPDLGILFQPAVLGSLIGLAVLSLIPVLVKRRRRAAGMDAEENG
ncbi:MAG: TVP38/TMEM64 family protein [Rhodospirillales bacterium]